MQNKQPLVYNRKPLQWLHDAWHLARPYWQSEDKWRAIALVSIVIVFNLLTVYMAVLFNKWNNGFYDALQHLDKVQFFKLLIKFSYMAFFYIIFQIVAYYFHKILEIRWRRWLTKYYLNKWLAHHAYYKTRFLANFVDNPDQRISQDIASFISVSLSLSLGFISNVVSLCSFVVVLWGLSGSFAVVIGGHHFLIAGYMVWAALIYAIVGTYITFKIGKPLIKLNFQQETVEANFRFGLMRVREYGENIAFYHGEAQEQQSLVTKFTAVVDNFVGIIFRQLKINIFNIAYSQIANIFPIVVASPRYFAKIIQLGDLMQIASAFGEVQGALSYFIDAYGSLAGWRAVMDRLYGFTAAVALASELDPVVKHENTHSYLTVKNLDLMLPDKTTYLARRINFNLAAGERLWIRGASGCGKTTLLRTLAGLWPFSQGEILQNATKRELFIGQRPYMPSVSLRAAIAYPLTTLPSTDELLQVLRACGIAYLAPRLDEDADWGKILSLGEQQRVAFARILINQPDIIYLDEATSAVDAAMEQHLYQILIEYLPNSVIISVGHSSGLAPWHNQELNFNNLQSA